MFYCILLMNLMILLYFKYEEGDEILYEGSYFMDFIFSCFIEFIIYRNLSLIIFNFLGIYFFYFYIL